MRLLDLAVILAYLVAIAAIGLRLSGRQESATAYFVGERDLPWWAVCFSIVATETSTLTVISVPGVAYLGAFGFVELAIGYLLGRSLVAWILLPLYMRGGFVSAYQYLRQRFGVGLQGAAAVTFLITRLLAEGVRLFASAIPIKLLMDAIGVPTDYITIIVVLSLVTVLYTYVGGIRAVIWTDAIQMTLYIGGSGSLRAGAAERGRQRRRRPGLGGRGKFQVLNFTAPVLTSPFNWIAAIVGGAVFSMASHGTDQLMVQRVLACRTLSEGRRAMVGSAVMVMIQFALFSMVGVLLWVHLGGKTPAEMGLRSSDDLVPAVHPRRAAAGSVRLADRGHPVGDHGLALLGAELDGELHRRRPLAGDGSHLQRRGDAAGVPPVHGGLGGRDGPGSQACSRTPRARWCCWASASRATLMAPCSERSCSG